MSGLGEGMKRGLNCAEQGFLLMKNKTKTNKNHPELENRWAGQGTAQQGEARQEQTRVHQTTNCKHKEK